MTAVEPTRHCLSPRYLNASTPIIPATKLIRGSLQLFLVLLLKQVIGELLRALLLHLRRYGLELARAVRAVNVGAAMGSRCEVCCRCVFFHDVAACSDPTYEHLATTLLLPVAVDIRYKPCLTAVVRRT